MGQEHPLTAGVTVIYTRHLGPYLSAVRGEMTLADAAHLAAALDAHQPGNEHGQPPEDTDSIHCGGRRS